MTKKIETDPTKVIIEAGSQVVELTSALQKLDTIDQGLAVLKGKYAGLTADAATTTGMDLLKAARAEIREVRYKVPKIVDASTKEINALKKSLQGKGEYIETELHSIEDPIHDQIVAEEKRKELAAADRAAKERNRISSIQEAIGLMVGVPAKVAFESSEVIMAALVDLTGTMIDERFAEFANQAEATKNASLAKLQELFDAKVKQEEEAEHLRIEREEFDKQQGAFKLEQEQKEKLKTKLDSLRMPIVAPGTSSDAMTLLIDDINFKSKELYESVYGEFLQEAKDLCCATFNALTGLHEQTLAVEKERKDFRLKQEAFDNKVKEQAEEDEKIKLRNEETNTNIQKLETPLVTDKTSSTGIQELIDHSTNRDLSVDLYGDFLDKAIAINNRIIEGLKISLLERLAQEAEVIEQQQAQEALDIEALRAETEKRDKDRLARMGVLEAILEVARDKTRKDAREQIIILATKALEVLKQEK